MPSPKDAYHGEIFIPDKRHPWFPFFCPKPQVDILFYTDDTSVAFNPAASFGVDAMRDLLHQRSGFHADFRIDLLNRHDGGHARQKLTPELLAKYDQVWFFGVLQCNQQSAPENELTDDEVAALRTWMDDREGGVLITGDHSNPRPFDAVDGALDPLVNLGRALGHRVPRAGQLRVWEGLPSSDVTTDPHHTHNTQVPDGVHVLDDLTLQDDQFPQRLLLTKYPLGWSWPWWLRRYRPHPLFCGRTGPIEVFPDHMHEGALAFPAGYPAADWPSGPWGQPVPEVVARGTDKRFPATYDLVSAYDGALASVGRIVADSTWHHYFNINLAGFAPGSAERDAIGDYYANLAAWLTPSAKRAAMRCWFWWQLAVHPAVHMVKGASFTVLGQTALDVLGRVAGQCTITQLVWPFPLWPRDWIEFPWPPEEVVLGAVISGYHAAFDQATAGAGELPSRTRLVGSGLLAAVEQHGVELRRMAETADRLPGFLREHLPGGREG
ncbi:hypothetical protein [Amycolatopsis sp. NPDC004169]|uniref:hypothetical protein n=1 Tax=Amycolatopsis sp. NPDC004169 TaxID=3154453 RepID=UPI0033B25041